MIDIELRGQIAIVWLRAGKANAMNLRLLDAIAMAFDEVEQSEATAVVITGEHRAFSAGRRSTATRSPAAACSR